jgi:CheY-like chemotaxis protein
MTTKPVSVLVVEDNRADAELVVEELEGTPGVDGVLVQVVQDGRAALEYLQANKGTDSLPDLMLLDLNMPRCGGLEMLEELGRDVELRRIPALVLTTSKSQREINQSYELGAAAVLNKPMRLSEQRELMHALQTFWLKYVRLPREGL